MNRKYPQDLQERAVSMVHQRRTVDPTDRTIFREVAADFSVGEQSLRLWVQKFDERRLANESDATPPAPASGDPTVELEALRRKIQKLQAENDVLKQAFVVLSSEWIK